MAKEQGLRHPWLVAVWPGMGSVALSAGFYLLAKLGMYEVAEFEATDLFETDRVEVKEGLIESAYRPRSRFFVSVNPRTQHDLVVFIGEAQPPLGKYPFCRKLLEYARQLGVERVFTFAAMGTGMRPEAPSRVFTAATDTEQLTELRSLDVEVLEEGYIGGLNGVLLGVAAETGLPGTCLLGEIPQVFSQLPFPKASLAVLKTFTSIFPIELDFTELENEAENMEHQLGEVLEQIEEQMGQRFSVPEEPTPSETDEAERLTPEDRRYIEGLFEQARSDRAKAYELKRELDRRNVFKEYEDLFLDLFKKSEDSP